MQLENLLNRTEPSVPDEIARLLEKNEITGTPFEGMNDILTSEKLQNDVGFKRLSNAVCLVSMVCPMPGVTREMIEWWFWWHPQADIRYRAWFPQEHFSISYSKRNEAYFKSARLPAFEPNTQYPVERIGKALKAQLSIEFISPDKFGFSPEKMRQGGASVIVCGHVGVLKGAVRHTEMAHIFKQTENGLFLISRFWLGQSLKSAALRRLIITDRLAMDMARHCCLEYRSLAEILPPLYNEYR